MLLVVLGGTRTNIDLQALDANDEPIPGLFNVGTMIVDFYSGVYTFAFPRIGAIQSVCNPPAEKCADKLRIARPIPKTRGPRPAHLAERGPRAHTGVVTAPLLALFTPQLRCGRRRSRS